MNTRTGNISEVPDPCFFLRDIEENVSVRADEGLLVFSTADMAKKYLKNFPGYEDFTVVSSSLEGVRSQEISVVIDYVSPDTTMVIVAV